MVAGEGIARLGVRIGTGAQRIAGMRRGGMHHHGAGHAKAGDAKPDRV
jgi:hypothetical protein